MLRYGNAVYNTRGKERKHPIKDTKQNVKGQVFKVLAQSPGGGER
jgi:hypothetical protein